MQTILTDLNNKNSQQFFENPRLKTSNTHNHCNPALVICQ